MSQLPEIIHVDELGALLGLTARRISQKGDEMELVKPKDAHYVFAEFIRALLKERDKKETPAVERLNLAKAKREERKDRVESSEIIEATTVIRAWENVTVTWRQRMLKVGNNVQSKVGLTEIQRKSVDEEIVEGLKELDKKLNYASEIAEQDEEKAVEALNHA